MRFNKFVIAYLMILTVAGTFASSPVSAQAYQSYSFSLSGLSYMSCWYWAVMFNATQGQRFNVKWNETAGIPTSLDLYITNLSSFGQVWVCDRGPVSLYSNTGAFGSANWAAPSAGEFTVLLVNYNYNSVSGTLSITAANATVTGTPLGYGTALLPPRCPGNAC